jgi:hypothetical protein
VAFRIFFSECGEGQIIQSINQWNGLVVYVFDMEVYGKLPPLVTFDWIAFCALLSP